MTARSSHEPQEHEHDDWIRERVIERVGELGWTDSLVARRAGVTQPAVSRYLARTRGVTSATLARILTAIGLTIEREWDR